MVVVEEGWPTCSIASEIAAICMEEGFDDLDAPVLRVTNEDVPMPYAANLEKVMLIDSDKVVKAAKKDCYKDRDFNRRQAKEKGAALDAPFLRVTDYRNGRAVSTVWQKRTSRYP